MSHMLYSEMVTIFIFKIIFIKRYILRALTRSIYILFDGWSTKWHLNRENNMQLLSAWLS